MAVPRQHSLPRMWDVINAYRKVDTTVIDLYVAISVNPPPHQAQSFLPESLYSIGSVLASVDLLSELVLLKTPG